MNRKFDFDEMSKSLMLNEMEKSLSNRILKEEMLIDVKVFLKDFREAERMKNLDSMVQLFYLFVDRFNSKFSSMQPDNQKLTAIQMKKLEEIMEKTTRKAEGRIDRLWEQGEKKQYWRSSN